MTKITLHDSQEPFTPRRDRSEGFYRRSEPDAHGEPVPVDIPVFLQEPEFVDTQDASAVPEKVASILAEAGLQPTDSYERVNDLLVTLFNEAKGSAELSRSYGTPFNGKSVIEWERRAQSINESIRWNSGRRIETI